jgi:hypothetical protein
LASGVFVGAREPSGASGLVAGGDDTHAPMMLETASGRLTVKPRRAASPCREK